MAGEQRESSSASQQGIPLPELIAAILGGLLVAAMLGYQVYKAIEREERAPRISLEVRSIQALGPGYLVEIAVANHGTQTAAGLGIEGRLLRNGQPVAQRQTELDYSPPHSQRTVGLYFEQDPRPLQLELRPLGYQLP